MAYLFGDSRAAADRLELLAEMFGPCSRAFLQRSVPTCPDLAVDLGCGIGHTARMLAETLGARRTVGLDNSEPFIAESVANAAGPAVSFRLHDVTNVPFPVGPCDVIYCRFLLSHQTDPLGLIERWATQLAPGGQLLLEEVESILTSVAPFTRYLEIVTAMLANDGQTLCVGGALTTMAPPAGTVRVASDIGCVPATTDAAARLFAMNIRTWRHNAFVQATCATAEIDDLQRRLDELAAQPTDRREIEWRLRQLVLQRPPGA